MFFSNTKVSGFIDSTSEDSDIEAALRLTATRRDSGTLLERPKTVSLFSLKLQSLSSYVKNEPALQYPQSPEKSRDYVN